MTSTSFSTEELAEMRREHDGIFAALKLVRRGLAMLDPDKPTPEALAAQVRTWRTRLHVHLMEEDRNALHARLEELFPAAKDELDTLRAQHAEILRGLEVVGGRLKEGKVVDFTVVRDRLDAIELLWCQHERAEARLLAEALGQEPPAEEEPGGATGGAA